MPAITRALLALGVARAASAAFVPAASPLLRWSGRYAVDDAAAGTVAFDSESTACAFTVLSPGPNATNVWLVASLALASPANVGRVSVYINDYEAQNLLLVQGSAVRYLLAAGLAPGANNVSVAWAMEPIVGGTDRPARLTPVFLGFDVEGPGALAAAAPLARRIDILGDSITAGSMYDRLEAVGGALSLETGCHPWAPAYGYSQASNWEAYLCRFFRANCTTTAWSGGALVDPATLNPSCRGKAYVPQLYRQTFLTDKQSVWDFSASSRPDAVIIYLGTNDYGCGVTDANFTAALVALVNNATRYYAASPGPPTTHFFLTLGPMAPTKPAAAVQAALAQLTGAGVAASLLNMTAATLDGCGGHPGPIGHFEMAVAAKAQIAAAMGW